MDVMYAGQRSSNDWPCYLLLLLCHLLSLMVFIVTHLDPS